MVAKWINNAKEGKTKGDAKWIIQLCRARERTSYYRLNHEEINGGRILRGSITNRKDL